MFLPSGPFVLVACTAYTRYVLDIGQSEDWLALQMALAPCLLGYGAVGTMLEGHDKTRQEGNTFWPWIQNYVADDYMDAVRLGSGKQALVKISLRNAIPVYAGAFQFFGRFETLLTAWVAIDLIEKHIQLQSPSRIEELVKIFIHATKVCHYPSCALFCCHI